MQEQNKNTSNTKTSLLSVAVLTLLILSIVATASAADNENGLTVQVNISEKTIIDIQPQTFAWGQGSTQVLPGSQAGPNEEQSGYGRIQVENLGSVNITQVWFNTSFPTQRPFGTGQASNYDSANFIGLDSNASGTDTNQFVNRREYGLDQPADQDIIYLETNPNWDYGRFRNTSREYFWSVDDTGADLSGASFRIGVDPHNSSQTGSTNLDNTCQGGDTAGANADCNEYSLTVTNVGGTDYAYTDIEVGVLDSTPLSNDGGEEYCVVMNETRVMNGGGASPEVNFIKWDKGYPAADVGDCGYATNYTVGSDGNTDTLVPGAWITQNIRAKVPYGVVSANLPTGSLFVLANSQ